MTKQFEFVRETKNYDLFEEVGNHMNKLYLPKTGAKALRVEITIINSTEVAK